MALSEKNGRYASKLRLSANELWMKLKVFLEASAEFHSITFIQVAFTAKVHALKRASM